MDSTAKNKMDAPSKLYFELVEKGEIQNDLAQVAALEYFDRLHIALSESKKLRWFERLLSFSAPQEITKGVYMVGGVGTGKTLLMDLFYRSLPQEVARRVHFHRFMQSIHERKKEIVDQQEPLKVIADEIADKHKVLCLDEFAVTDIADAMILYGLLKALFVRGVVLVTTSNVVQSELYKNGLQRDRFLPAIDLLEQYTDEVPVDNGNDYRMAYLQQDSIYHIPLDEETGKELKQCFEKLAGQYEESKENLIICGREVPVVATGSGVAWFECAVLCGGNRSAMDYIELSKRFHTLILSNIPQMDDNDNNMVRRLIELVDELYDRGVNLIVSAAARPEKLYAGKRLEEPFERTISRLQEMASAEYLARPHGLSIKVLGGYWDRRLA